MKVVMKLTLDGLLRALRMRAHRMADEIETSYAAAQERNRTGGRKEGADGDEIGGD